MRTESLIKICSTYIINSNIAQYTQHITVTFKQCTTQFNPVYRRRPLRPPFLLVLSDGIGVTSSTNKNMKSTKVQTLGILYRRVQMSTLRMHVSVPQAELRLLVLWSLANSDPSLTQVRWRLRHSKTRQLALRGNFHWLYGTQTDKMLLRYASHNLHIGFFAHVSRCKPLERNSFREIATYFTTYT